MVPSQRNEHTTPTLPYWTSTMKYRPPSNNSRQDSNTFRSLYQYGRPLPEMAEGTTDHRRKPGTQIEDSRRTSRPPRSPPSGFNIRLCTKSTLLRCYRPKTTPECGTPDQRSRYLGPHSSTRRTIWRYYVQDWSLQRQRRKQEHRQVDADAKKTVQQRRYQ